MSEATSTGTMTATDPAAPAAGRLAILTGLSLVASAIPLPFVPSKVVEHVRGAIAQDVAARHGLSLTNEARRIFAESASETPARLAARTAFGFVTKTFFKRLAPVSALLSATSAVEVYALGHLLERYVERHRGSNAVRVHADEARKLRTWIDRAILRAFSPSIHASSTPLLPGVEDLRDEFTRWIDTALLSAAGLPGYLERRLDAAFDAVVAEG
jgi:hypothetical protein